MKQTTERLAFTVPEAGAMLGLSRGSAYKAAASGDLPAVRVGGRWIVPRARLLALLGGEPRDARTEEAA